MTFLIIVVKLAVSIFILFPCLFVGVLRASPYFRTPGIGRKIDAFVGALFFIGGLGGLYWLWF